jgi:hypothetical protein
LDSMVQAESPAGAGTCGEPAADRPLRTRSHRIDHGLHSSNLRRQLPVPATLARPPAGDC